MFRLHDGPMTATIRSSTPDGRASAPRPWLMWITNQQRGRHWDDHRLTRELGLLSPEELTLFLGRANVTCPAYDDVRRVARAFRVPLPPVLVDAGLAARDEIGVPITAAVLSQFPVDVLQAEIQRRQDLASAP